MTADLQDLFDRAGRNPPAPALDPDAVLRRAARRSRDRRIRTALAAAVIVTVAVGVSVASHRRVSSAPLPATHTHASLGHLAYGIDGDIYLADADGKHPVRIADGTGFTSDGDPTCGQYGGEGSIWSPDGRYLAYRGGERAGGGGSCQGTVIIADAAGHRVASFPGSGWLISWSPDSTRVATWVDWGDRIGVYGLDGVRQALLTLPPGLMAPGDYDPVWAADGASLLVPHGVQIPLDGSTPRLVPMDDPRSQFMVTYSPDGAHVAYISRDGTSSLVVAAADGSRARVLITGVSRGVWSPTGDRIAFTSVTGDGTTTIGFASELRVVDVASGTVTSLAGKGGADTLGAIEFSPEGDQILFSRTDAKGVPALWSVHVDGSDPHLLVAGSDWGDWQAVSPGR